MRQNDPGSELDELLRSFCDQHWRKVARIAGQTYQALEARGIEITGATADAFDARMAVLVDTGQLEAAGNIKRWRFSEVRLPGAGRGGGVIRPLSPCLRERVATLRARRDRAG